MIQLFLYYLLAAVVVGTAIWSLSRPSASIGLFIGLYATEQMLLGRLQWAEGYGQAYNLAVGVVCSLAILRGFHKYGAPAIPWRYAAAFFSLFFLVCASFLWTPAPITASNWLRHFAVEGPLAFILPIVTLRSRDDFAAPIKVTVVLALITALWTLATPFGSGIGGRTLLLEFGAVLPPAQLMGTAVIAVALLESSTLGFLHRIRIPVGLILVGGLYLSGARGQFLASIALSAWVLFARRIDLRAMTLVGIMGLGFVVVTATALFVVADSDVEKLLPRTGRFSVESMSSGLEVRRRMVEKSISFDRPVFGHGIGGWSFMINRRDKIGRLENALKHPHNSLMQAWFELGLVGLSVFLWILAIGWSTALSLLRRYKGDPVMHALTAMAATYLAFEFVLSLKQSTVMGALGIYLSVSMLVALAQISRVEGRRTAESERSPLPT